MPLEIEGLWGRRRASWVKGFGSRFVVGPVPTDQRTDSSAPGVPPVMMRYKIHRTWYCSTRLVSPKNGTGKPVGVWLAPSQGSSCVAQLAHPWSHAPMPRPSRGPCWVRVVGIAPRSESMRLVVFEGRATGGPRCLLVPSVLGPGRQTTLAPTCAIFRRHVRCISKGAMAPRHDWSVGSFPGFPVSPPSVALKRSSPGLHPRSQDCTLYFACTARTWKYAVRCCGRGEAATSRGLAWA